VHPTSVFRYISELYVDDFIAGTIFTTTLGECRRYEDPERGDPVEGMQLYNQGRVSTRDDPEEYVRAMGARLGIEFEGELPNDAVFENNSILRITPDSWVLCTTLRDDPTAMAGFAKACVEIRAPVEFYRRMTKAILKEVPVSRADCGPIRYAGLVYRDLDPAPGIPGFVKRPDQYAHQREYRFLWAPSPHVPVVPRDWQCEEVTDLVRRVR
jgi:hypothetical protein